MRRWKQFYVPLAPPRGKQGVEHLFPLSFYNQGPPKMHKKVVFYLQNMAQVLPQGSEFI